MRKFLCFLWMMAVAVVGLRAQIVTTEPSIVQTDSHDIVITFHADQGNAGLKGMRAVDEVYAHTGVITNTSTSDSDWKYASTWLDNSAKYAMKWVADNTWTLTIPSINSYYGIPENEGIVVKKLAFVFRNYNGTREGKTASGGDIFVDVAEAGFVLDFICTSPSSVIFEGESLDFKAETSSASNISVYIDGATEPVAQAADTRMLELTQTFTSAGHHSLRAVAVYNGITKEQSLDINVLALAVEAPYPEGTPVMGPVTNPDGSVTFCIAAPEKKSVSIAGSWNNYAESQMNTCTADGIKYFWTTTAPLTAGKDYLYYFIVDGVTRTGDPYARLVLDPWNDQYIPESVYPSLPAYPTQYVTDVPLAIYNSTQSEYPWKVTDFHRAPKDNLIIYELLIRDFTGTEGSANADGTIISAMEKLDYLQQLGVNAVELLPIMEFSGNNSWGYNPNFYFAPDKAYGTPADYRRFIDECHSRGMAVILDIVLNHTDGLHPWYQMYDINANPLINATPPHTYSVFHDWKQEHPLVMQQWRDAIRYWVTEYKADGFRFDLVKGYGDSDSYGNTYDAANNTWGTPSEYNTNRYNATRVARMKVLHDVLREVAPDAYFINEDLAGAQEENEMGADGQLNWANINHGSCQFAMGYDTDASLNRFYAPDDSRLWGSTVSYAESHDEERMAYKQAQWGTAGVKNNPEQSLRRLGSVGAQMLMTPGAHMIWQFSEFGADETTKDSGGGNNTSPKKVIWSYLDNPLNRGLMESYRELCCIRTSNPQLFTEEANTTVALSSWQGRTLRLVNGADELYLVVNPSVTATATIATSADLSLPAYKLMSASYDTTPSASAAGVTLAPGAYAVYGTTNLKDLTGIDTPEADLAATRVSVRGHDIIIEGPAAAAAKVYAADGRLTRATSLAPGLYIVALPGQPSVKVAVR